MDNTTVHFKKDLEKAEISIENNYQVQASLLLLILRNKNYIITEHRRIAMRLVYLGAVLWHQDFSLNV